MLRILLENSVASLQSTTSKRCAAVASSARSSSTAVQASPKMKWLSRSRKFRCAEQISGFTISTARAWPEAMAPTAVWMPKVAEEQATFMSKA
ncbi:hypothetical protein D3C85_1033740 [compost metagenome]